MNSTQNTHCNMAQRGGTFAGMAIAPSLILGALLGGSSAIYDRNVSVDYLKTSAPFSFGTNMAEIRRANMKMLKYLGIYFLVASVGGGLTALVYTLGCDVSIPASDDKSAHPDPPK